MLIDYKQYIESLRNNLIQNNIQAPVLSIETYRELFEYSIILEQICWFYNQLSLIGSKYAVRSEYLTGEGYIEKVRQKSYREFMSYLEGYKKISKNYFLLEKLTKGFDGKEDSIQLNLEDEELDLFEEPKGKTFLDLLDTREENLESGLSDGKNMVELNQPSCIRGIFIDEWVKPTSISKDDFVPTNIGIEREDVVKEDTSNCIIHGIYIDEWKKQTIQMSIKDVVHGIYIDEWVKPLKPKGKDEIQVHGIFIDEWVKENKVVNNENVDETDGETAHGIYIDEWVKPLVEEQNNEESFWEDESDTSEEDEEDSWDDFIEQPEEKEDFQNSDINITKESEVYSKPVLQEKDLSDSIQDITNQVLTEGKRLLYKGFKNLQK